MLDKPQSDDQPLGVPPSEFHPERPQAPFKKRGNVKTVILVAVLIAILDLFIYFFLIRPDDAELLKAIEPLKPQETASAPTKTQQPTIIESTPSKAARSVSDLAKEDLAKRLNIPPQEIKLVSEKAVSWSDGSLGCPQPGMMYTQAIVEGTKVVLVAKQKDYNYHAGADGTPVLCEKETN